MTERDDRRIDLLRRLGEAGYAFVTPGQDSHRRVVRRRGMASDLRDVFGWNLPFRADTVGPEMFEAMGAAGLLVRHWRGWRSGLRVASLNGALFWHSAWPPTAKDAVFFGPDSYRFAAFVDAELPPSPLHSGPLRIADIGTGSGVGAIAAALARPGSVVAASDVNPAALNLARVNAAAAGVDLTLARGSGLAGLAGEFDVIIANPPFIAGHATRLWGGRVYRDGGAELGMEVALAWAEEAAGRLAPGGRLLLYSGAPVVAGVDRLREALERRLVRKGLALRYREIDPDIFGGLLNHPRYWGVERIAAIGAVAERQA